MEAKTKYILLGFGVVVVGTGAYLIYQNQKSKTTGFTDQLNTNTNNSATPTLPSKPSSSSGSSSSSREFPLRKGSRGSLVTNLQNALIRKYGSSILPRYGADGGFGTETLNALISKGLPTSIDSNTYTNIVLSSGSSAPSANGSTPNTDIGSSGLSSMLHKAILEDNIDKATLALSKIKDVAGYSAVSNIFKKTRIGVVRKTLVTGLLDQFSSSSEKKQINNHFYRMGLKYNGSHWSLSGLSGVTINQLVTKKATKVWDNSGKTVLIPAQTIVGSYLDTKGGVTEIETMDGQRLFIQTAHIYYQG